MTELKPCPFCGGEAHTYKNQLWHVACERARHGCVTMSAFGTEAEAVEAWNTRAERTCTMLRLTDCTCQYMHRYLCSECGEYNEQPTVMGKSTPPNYCPNCGAKVVDE